MVDKTPSTDPKIRVALVEVFGEEATDNYIQMLDMIEKRKGISYGMRAMMYGEAAKMHLKIDRRKAFKAVRKFPWLRKILKTQGGVKR